MTAKIFRYATALLLLAPGCPRNKPPDTPVIAAGPAVIAPGEQAVFRLTGRDPEGYSVSFRCAWGDGDTSNWSEWVGSGETASLSYAWDQVGSYFVTAQARDPQEAESGWSELFEILVGSPPRRPTRPEGPNRGWTDTSYSYTTVSTDPDYDELRYVFDWGDGAVETTGFFRSGERITLAHTWTGTDTYDLSVRALDRPGLPSLWSETLRVAIRDIDGPGLPLWRYELGPGVAVAGVPALVDDRLLFGAGDGLLRCLDTSGNELWTFVTRGPVTTSPAVAADGAILFGSDDSSLYRLAPDGSLSWEYRTDGPVRSSPALAPDGTVMFGSDDGQLYCLNPDGSLRWKYETDGPVRSSPALGPDHRVCFGSGDHGVYMLNPDGGLAWRFATEGPVDASPALGTNGTVYVTSRDGWLYALRPDGSLLWREYTGEGSVSSPAVGNDDNIYVGTETGRILALYPTGGPVWEIELPAPVRSSPLLDSELTACFGSGQRLYAVDFQTGRVAWYLTLPGEVNTSATVSEQGTIYIGDSAGNFWAVRGAGGLNPGPWPKFRRDPRNTGRAGP